MKKYIIFIFCLLMLLTLVSCTTPEAPTEKTYWGYLWNACDGTCICAGEALNFYIDNIFIETINAGKKHKTYLTAGEHIVTVIVTSNQEVVQSGYELIVEGDGWHYAIGCSDGTWPEGATPEPIKDGLISSYSGYIR